MSQVSQWIGGARPRTLPAALVPVAVGAAIAYFLVTNLEPWQFVLRTILALVVSFGLQIGVNYANDYSDGIRGTDENRVGPIRLVGQGLAKPNDVKRAAFISFGVAALAGLILVLITQAWWLLLVGLVAIAAGWFYTGGSRPYGYSGYGEFAVFFFFGPVAVTGTTFVLVGHIAMIALILSIPIGFLATALLVTNNLRDIPTDVVSGKKTLAVQLGESRTRELYTLCLVISYAICTLVGLLGLGLPQAFPLGALAVLASLPIAYIPWRQVANGARGRDLVRVLGQTSAVQIFFGLLLVIGLVISR